MNTWKDVLEFLKLVPKLLVIAIVSGLLAGVLLVSVLAPPMLLIACLGGF
jgi:hypothetical protein